MIKACCILIGPFLIWINIHAQQFEWVKQYDEVLSGTTIHYVGENKYGHLFRDGIDKQYSRLKGSEIGFFYVNEKQEIYKSSDMLDCQGMVKYARVADETITIVTIEEEGKEKIIAYHNYDAETFEHKRTEILFKQTLKGFENFNLNFAESEDGEKIMLSWLQVHSISDKGVLYFKVFTPNFKELWGRSFYPDIKVQSNMVSLHDFAVNNKGEISALFSSYYIDSENYINNDYFHFCKISPDEAKTNSIKSKIEDSPEYAKAHFTRDGNVFVAIYYNTGMSAILYNPDSEWIINYTNGNQSREGRIDKIIELENGNIVTLGHERRIVYDYTYYYYDKYITVDITSPSGKVLHSLTVSKAPFAQMPGIFEPPFTGYDAFSYGNNLYLLYTASIKDKPLINTDKDKSRYVNTTFLPKKGAFYIMKIDQNGRAERKMIWDYKTDDQLYYPISYPINETEIGVFKANKKIITSGKADIRF